MRSMSAVFAAVLIVAALAAPSALAMPAPPDMMQRIHSDRPNGIPTWPEYPQPITQAETPPAPTDGFPWDTLGLVLAAAGIGLAGAVAVVRVRRRVHRTHPVA